MKHATTLALHAYWQNRQRADGVRARMIDAAELAPILPSLFLLDCGGHPGATFAFCGSAITSRYGRDLCHGSFLALWDGADRELFDHALRTMSSEPKGFVAGSIAETVGGGFTSFEILLLPLSGEAGTAGAIGSMARIGGHQETNRFRARIVSQSLRSSRFLEVRGNSQAHRPPTSRPTLVYGSGEGRRHYGHLTVVPGGRVSSFAQRPTLTDN